MDKSANGEQKLTNLLNEQDNISLVEVFGGEQWLLQNNIVSDRAVDTLLGYAFMQPGVKSAKIGIDLDQKGEGEKPKVIYEVKLSFFKGLKYKVANHFASRKGIFNKLIALIVIKLGSPAPGEIEGRIARLAMAFLPKNYSVQIELE